MTSMPLALLCISILGRLHWIDQPALQAFILSCQDGEGGGISDRPDDMVDVYHTFFGVGVFGATVGCLSLLLLLQGQARGTLIPARCSPLLHAQLGWRSWGTPGWSRSTPHLRCPWRWWSTCELRASTAAARAAQVTTLSPQRRLLMNKTAIAPSALSTGALLTR